MSQPISFAVHVDQNEYLPAGESVMDVAISVTASSGADGATGPPPTAAQVIMIDRSLSMYGTKLDEAKQATAVAIDTLRDGVSFAVVAGNAEATMLYPRDHRMVPATASSRAEAKEAISHLTASGGTRIGAWLELANLLLRGERVRIKHGLLLTDGRNEHQTPEELNQILKDCRGAFACDSRGVGDGWDSTPLLAIAEELHGFAVGLPDPGKLTADFRSVVEKVMGKAAADVSLRLWTIPDVRVRFLKQVFPRIVDLSERGAPAGERTVDYPTGQWGDETRDFHLAVEVPAGTVGGNAIRVAKVRMVTGEHQSDNKDNKLVRVRWTNDPALSTKINPRVAHLTGQAELADAIAEGLAARASGDDETATANLRRAVELAERSGREDTLRLLRRVVEVDPVTGTARLRRNMKQVDAEMLNLDSVTTKRVRGGDS